MRLVLCNCAPADADRLAATLVEERLAACVNIVPAVTSVYRWQGRIERDTESTLWIKTSNATFPAMVERLRALHPYDTPEILSVGVDERHSDSRYMAWVDKETGATT